MPYVFDKTTKRWSSPVGNGYSITHNIVTNKVDIYQGTDYTYSVSTEPGYLKRIVQECNK